VDRSFPASPEGLIDLGQIEYLGIELPADPLGQLLMAFVLEVGEGLKEFRVAADAAAILGRAGPRAGQADGADLLAAVGWGDLFDLDLVLPAVADVVDVDELVTGLGRGVAEVDGVVIADVAPLGVGLGVAVWADLEHVEVAVGPAHGALEDVVELGEGEVAGDEDAAPDGRGGAEQNDFKLIGMRGGRLSIFFNCL